MLQVNISKCQEIENDIATSSVLYGDIENDDDIENNFVANSVKGKKNLSKANSRFIPYTIPLSPLTYDLEFRLKRDGILKAQRYFIAFWGNYFWQTTSTKPTRKDYSNLASNIVAAYPQLAGGTTANVNIIYYI